MSLYFKARKIALIEAYKRLIYKNTKQNLGNGIYDRYQNPVLTAEHTPVFWKYDLNEKLTLI